MLARNAQGLYWMGRYLERARHGCRLLSDQLATMEDRPVEQIEQSWRRLYRAIDRNPLGGHLEATADDEDFMLADAFTLADDLTFEPNNPDSIRYCVAAARENARQVRNAIGNRMWSCLNLAYLDLRDVEIQTIWNDRPGAFYLRTENAIRTFSGIAEGGMYRDDGWHFLELGRFVERAQLLAALLDAHIAIHPTGNSHGESDWRSLLRICEAHFAYRHLHALDHRPGYMIDFLVADPRLAHSIRHAMARIVDAPSTPSPAAGRWRWKPGAAPAGWRPASTMTGPTATRATTTPRAPLSGVSGPPAAASTTTSTPPTSTTKSRTRRGEVRDGEKPEREKRRPRNALHRERFVQHALSRTTAMKLR